MTSIFKTFIGSIFGGGIRGTGLNSVGATGGYNSLAAFADGGSIGQGQPALVGERGPELFVPRSAGTIVPNHVLGGGGTTNVTNNYIQAIDVQSFEQRLLGSSNTIWAANQYAQKSLATGRGRT
jgi:phage-related minor tail protein